jgi:hypothetical protein
MPGGNVDIKPSGFSADFSAVTGATAASSTSLKSVFENLFHKFLENLFYKNLYLSYRLFTRYPPLGDIIVIDSI